MPDRRRAFAAALLGYTIQNVDALVKFCALGCAALKSPPSNPDLENALLESLELLMVEFCLRGPKEDITPLMLDAALHTARYLEQRRPDLAQSIRVFKAVLSAFAGEARLLEEVFESMSDNERTVAFNLVDHAKEITKMPLPPQTKLWLFRRGKTPLLDPRALYHSEDFNHKEVEGTVYTLTNLSEQELYALVANQSFLAQIGTIALQELKLILESALRSLDPLRIALVRCALSDPEMGTVLSTPSDCVRVAESCPEGIRQQVLYAVGKQVNWHLARGGVNEAVMGGRLSLDDALALLSFSIPLAIYEAQRLPESTGWTKIRTNLRKLLPLATEVQQQALKLYRRLLDGKLEEDALQALAARGDETGAVARAALCALAPERLDQPGGLEALQYPYHLLLDLPSLIARAPWATFKAVTEGMSSPFLPIHVGAIAHPQLMQESLKQQDWSCLSPAQRGLLLGAILSAAGELPQGAKRRAIDLALDGLAPEQVEAVQQFVNRVWSELGGEVEEEVQDYFDAAAARLGSNARLLPPRGNKFVQVGEWRMYGAEFIRLLTEPLTTAENGHRAAQKLSDKFPAPNRGLVFEVMLLLRQMPRKAKRAFLLALSPQWVLAIGLSAPGTLVGLPARFFAAVAAQLDEHKRRLFFSLRPVNQALRSMAGAPPRNTIERLVLAGDLMELAFEHDPSSPISELGQQILKGFNGECVDLDGGAFKLAAAAREAEMALRRGHYPLIHSALPVLKPPSGARRSASSGLAV